MAQRASQQNKTWTRENVAKVQAEAKVKAPAANTRYAFNVAESFGQAAQDLLNVTRMPAGTVGDFAELGGSWRFSESWSDRCFWSFCNQTR
jgi:hypothetical protein